jgi:excisionase family DNA binding protein
MNELLTVAEAAALLRTTPAGVYARVARGALPEVVRDGSRVLFNARALRKRLGLSTIPPVGTGSERNQ